MPSIPIGFTVPSSRTAEPLVAIGAGTITLIAVVYSLLFLVVQFGSTTFTPRLNLFRDAPIIPHSFGYFTAIATFSLTCLFSIGQDGKTSGLVPIVGIVALLAGLALFRVLQGAAFASIQLATALEQVTARGRDRSTTSTSRNSGRGRPAATFLVRTSFVGRTMLRYFR